MTTALMNSPVQPTATGLPRPLRLTCREFHNMGEAGMFVGRRAMLIDGVILEQGPMNPPHAIAVPLAANAMQAAFGSGWHVRCQLPLVLGLSTDPMPDNAIVRGLPRDYTKHPIGAGLVIEISDTTLAFDRDDKALLYAAGSIADYWVVDLVNRQLLVFRDPQADPAQPHGYSYQQQTTFGPSDSVAPLAASNSAIAVADLLP